MSRADEIIERIDETLFEFGIEPRDFHQLEHWEAQLANAQKAVEVAQGNIDRIHKQLGRLAT